MFLQVDDAGNRKNNDSAQLFLKKHKNNLQHEVSKKKLNFINSEVVEKNNDNHNL